MLVKGPYLGDVTALCFVKLPWDSPLPALLAGTGAQVDCYDLATGKQYFSSHVFDGVRVHGIYSVQSTCTASSFAIVAVHGERRVKLLKMSYESSQNQMSLELWQTIPRFTKWVLDVRIFQDGDAVEVTKFIAIGLSDNTVWLWDLCLCQMVYHVDCFEKCLLYSMRLWGNSVETLRVAAGTIYNEVLVWKLERPELIQPNDSTILHSRNGRRNSLCNDCPNQEAKPIQRFCGHEGSIYRISWSEDGRFLGSVSDDRSARIWKADDPNSQAVAVLFGHAARVWDLHIDEKLLITASEDCTCGLWSWTGKLYETLKGHVGRGIWRCIYDSQTAVLVTAGADASMKLYSLSEWVFKTKGCDNSRKEMELIHISLDKTEGNRDSKSEYVRCISLVGPSSLYIATNRGLLRHANLLALGSLEWFSVLQTSRTSPIVCMDILAEGEMAVLGDTNDYKEEFIACGDGQGHATVVKIAKNKSQLQLLWQCTWLAEADRQLLGIFWCKNLGSRLVFTTDPKGGLRCWSLQHAAEMSQDAAIAPRLVAYFKSALCSRIVCLDACVKKQLLACGDQRGNLVIFSLPVTLHDSDRATPSVEVESSDAFRGAHGVSAVASVSISGNADHQTEIVSTGRDGCVCKFAYGSNASFVRPTSPGFSCTGVEKVTAITVVESVLYRAVRSGAKRRIAAGFSAADFVLWDSTNEVELKRIPCGGWRRPHSFLIGDSPETQYCFAYLKEQVICVCRSWADTSSEIGLQQQSLQRQSHGREIHTVLFTPHLMPNMDWVLTGSEDGMVQITRYVGGLQEQLTVSSTLGEHVGGSAVRALALSSNVYTFDGSSNENHESEPVLLFSAGAKEVLTCWSLEWAPKSLGNINEDNNMSAKWLSTYTTFNKKTMQKDDLRYLALTVFSIQPAGGGTLIYFVVTAMSNATLTVKAFDFSNRIWCKVAVLEHHKAPVLALQHAVLPPLKQGLSSAKRFYVFSGSTDGSIAVWDLTHVVGSFVMKSGMLGAQGGIQLRPRSGRGSQGGKRRSRLNLEAVNGGLSDQHPELKTVEDHQSNQPDSKIGVPFVECDETQNPTLHPMFVLPRCHQSGVNCLSVCTIEGSTISVVSGGDDQALHFTTLSVHDAVSVQSEDEATPAYKITASIEHIISNAHSSALKGVWTDGKWVFSTGLDQRLRCWCHKSSSGSIELTESYSCVIDVPEAEALHARALHNGEGYCIAIVGRGLQIVNFV